MTNFIYHNQIFLRFWFQLFYLPIWRFLSWVECFYCKFRKTPEFCYCGNTYVALFCLVKMNFRKFQWCNCTSAPPLDLPLQPPIIFISCLVFIIKRQRHHGYYDVIPQMKLGGVRKKYSTVQEIFFCESTIRRSSIWECLILLG